MEAVTDFTLTDGELHVWWNDLEGTHEETIYLRNGLARQGGLLSSWASLGALTSTAVALLLLLFGEAATWAGVYVAMGDATGLRTFEDALYFSLVTFATVGYGDVVLSGHHRILAGIEAMNGILLFGWSSATLYSVVSFVWRNTRRDG